MPKTRLSADIKNPLLIKLLKSEAQEKDTTITEVVTQALEVYFSHKIENLAFLSAAESAFSEWNDPRDSDYDNI